MFHRAGGIEKQATGLPDPYGRRIYFLRLSVTCQCKRSQVGG